MSSDTEAAEDNEMMVTVTDAQSAPEWGEQLMLETLALPREVIPSQSWALMHKAADGFPTVQSAISHQFGSPSPFADTGPDIKELRKAFLDLNHRWLAHKQPLDDASSLPSFIHEIPAQKYTSLSTMPGIGGMLALVRTVNSVDADSGPKFSEPFLICMGPPSVPVQFTEGKVGCSWKDIDQNIGDKLEPLGLLHSSENVYPIVSGLFRKTRTTTATEQQTLVDNNWSSIWQFEHGLKACHAILAFDSLDEDEDTYEQPEESQWWIPLNPENPVGNLKFDKADKQSTDIMLSADPHGIRLLGKIILLPLGHNIPVGFCVAVNQDFTVDAFVTALGELKKTEPIDHSWLLTALLSTWCRCAALVPWDLQCTVISWEQMKGTIEPLMVMPTENKARENTFSFVLWRLKYMLFRDRLLHLTLRNHGIKVQERYHAYEACGQQVLLNTPGIPEIPLESQFALWKLTPPSTKRWYQKEGLDLAVFTGQIPDFSWIAVYTPLEIDTKPSTTAGGGEQVDYKLKSLTVLSQPATSRDQGGTPVSRGSLSTNAAAAALWRQQNKGTPLQDGKTPPVQVRPTLRSIAPAPPVPPRPAVLFKATTGKNPATNRSVDPKSSTPATVVVPLLSGSRAAVGGADTGGTGRHEVNGVQVALPSRAKSQAQDDDQSVTVIATVYRPPLSRQPKKPKLLSPWFLPLDSRLVPLGDGPFGPVSWYDAIPSNSVTSGDSATISAKPSAAAFSKCFSGSLFIQGLQDSDVDTFAFLCGSYLGSNAVLKNAQKPDQTIHDDWKTLAGTASNSYNKRVIEQKNPSSVIYYFREKWRQSVDPAIFPRILFMSPEVPEGFWDASTPLLRGLKELKVSDALMYKDVKELQDDISVWHFVASSPDADNGLIPANGFSAGKGMAMPIVNLIYMFTIILEDGRHLGGLPSPHTSTFMTHSPFCGCLLAAIEHICDPEVTKAWDLLRRSAPNKCRLITVGFYYHLCILVQHFREWLTRAELNDNYCLEFVAFDPRSGAAAGNASTVGSKRGYVLAQSQSPDWCLSEVLRSWIDELHRYFRAAAITGDTFTQAAAFTYTAPEFMLAKGGSLARRPAESTTLLAAATYKTLHTTTPAASRAVTQGNRKRKEPPASSAGTGRPPDAVTDNSATGKSCIASVPLFRWKKQASSTHKTFGKFWYEWRSGTSATGGSRVLPPRTENKYICFNYCVQGSLGCRPTQFKNGKRQSCPMLHVDIGNSSEGWTKARLHAYLEWVAQSDINEHLEVLPDALARLS